MACEDIRRTRRDAVEAAIPSLVGVEAVYRERPTWMFVRLESILASDDGVGIRMVPIAAPGIPLEEGPPYWDISASWDIFGVGNQHRYWNTIHLNWALFFDAGLIRKLKALGGLFTEAEDAGERWRRLREYVDRYQAVIDIQALMRDLRRIDNEESRLLVEEFEQECREYERMLRVPGDDAPFP